MSFLLIGLNPCVLLQGVLGFRVLTIFIRRLSFLDKKSQAEICLIYADSGQGKLESFLAEKVLMSGSITVCKRCSKEFSGPQCPYCTVTGVDLEALLSAEEMKLLRGEDRSAPVALVDMVTGKSIAIITPLCKIGRDLANDIPLSGDRSMSRFHFQIRQTGQDYYIEDCGSRNGTFLNGSPIALPRKLHQGDIVSAGISRYEFKIKDLAGAPGENEKADAKQNGDEAAEPVSDDNEISRARETLQKMSTVKQPPGQGEIDQESSETVELEKNFADEMPCVASPETNVPPGEVESAPEEQEIPPDELETSPRTKGIAPPPQRISPERQGAGLPSWLDEYFFPEVQKLMSEKERLNGLMEEIRQDIKQIDRKIASAQTISRSLLSSAGPELGQASKQVFDALDWAGEISTNNPFELTLKKPPKIEAVVRIVVCRSEPSAKDFEALVNQQAVIWCQSNYEPKGIMLVQVQPELAPSQRPPLSRDFLESMRRKKVCVVQPTQLLAIYRLAVLGGQDRNYFRELLLTTCGSLPGFMMKPQGSRSATT